MRFDPTSFEPDQYGNGGNLDEYDGKPVVDYKPGEGFDPATKTYRLGIDYDDGEAGATLPDRAAAFLAEPNVGEVAALVVGNWPESYEDSPEPLVELLVAEHAKLPKLRKLFFGDIGQEENEISWIIQGDVAPLLRAFGSLEEFTVRGGTSLQLGTLDLPNLKSLTIQTGGMDAEIVRDVLASNLPRLEKLVLWLGTEEYGGNVTLEDLQPLLGGAVLPALKFAGLCDYDHADDLAVALADAKLLDRIDVLDLSMGTLGDAGAKALLASDRIKRLDRLILIHHYVPVETIAKMEADAAAGHFPQIEHGDPQQGDHYDGEEHRYVACGE